LIPDSVAILGQLAIIGAVLGTPSPHNGPSANPRSKAGRMRLVDHPVFVVFVVAVAAPLLAELPVGRRVPIVVLEVLLGIVVGPYVQVTLLDMAPAEQVAAHGKKGA
jgi:H+/Cl- antiporter ClcA